MSMEGTIVLVTGPSGVGKTTVVGHLLRLEPSLKQVDVYTTRPPRPSDTDRKSVSIEELRRLERDGKVLVLERYGELYGEPISDITDIQKLGLTPIMDFGGSLVGKLMSHLPLSGSFVVYLFPKSTSELRERVQKEGRDPTGERYVSGLEEMAMVRRGYYEGIIDVTRVNHDSEATARNLLPLIRKKVAANKQDAVDQGNPAPV